MPAIRVEKALIVGGFAFNLKPVLAVTGLCKDYRFIDINSFPADYSLKDMQDKVAREIDCYQPQIVIAYSMGGLLALGALELSLMKSIPVILINSSPYFIKNGIWQGIQPADFASLMDRLNKGSLHEFMCYLTRLFAYPKLKGKPSDYSSWWSYVSQEQLSNILDILFHTDLRATAANHKERIFWLWSKDDNLLKTAPTQGMEIFQNHLILNNSSHLLINQEQLVIAISKVIEGLP